MKEDRAGCNLARFDKGRRHRRPARNLVPGSSSLRLSLKRRRRRAGNCSFTGGYRLPLRKCTAATPHKHVFFSYIILAISLLFPPAPAVLPIPSYESRNSFSTSALMIYAFGRSGFMYFCAMREAPAFLDSHPEENEREREEKKRRIGKGKGKGDQGERERP